MREPTAPHRLGILLADRILVAGHKGDGDPRLAARQPAVDMPRQPCRTRSSPPRGPGRPARPAPATCRPRRSPGTTRRGRSRRSRAPPSAAAASAARASGLAPLTSPSGALSWSTDTRTRGGSAGRPAPGSGGPCPWRPSARPVRSSPRAPRSLGRSSLGAPPIRRAPTPGAAERRGTARTSRAPVRSAPARRKAAQAKPGRETNERSPVERPAEREPGGDAGAEPDHQPRRKLRALRLEQPFKPLSKR